MSSTTADTDPDKHYYHSEISALWPSALRKLNRIIYSYVIFNLVFFLVACIEIFLVLSFFAFLSQSTVLAFSLAVFFMTIFSYFVLRLYLQAKKPDQLLE